MRDVTPPTTPEPGFQAEAGERAAEPAELPEGYQAEGGEHAVVKPPEPAIRAAVRRVS